MLATIPLLLVGSLLEGYSAWVTWVILLPWLWVLDRTHTVSQALVAGVVMSVVFAGTVFTWFAPAISSFTDLPSWAVFLALLAAGPVLEPQFVAFALVRQRVRLAGASWIIVAVAGAGAWVGTEWLFPKLFGDSLSHALYPSPLLRQGADIAGAAGLTFLLVLSNEATLCAFRRWTKGLPLRRVLGPVAFSLFIVAGLMSYGAARLNAVEAATSAFKPLTAVMVQASIGSYHQLRDQVGSAAAMKRIVETHLRLSGRALTFEAPAFPVELVVWPETAYPTTLGKPKSESGADFDRELLEFVRKSGRALMAGTYDREDGREFNAAVLLQADDNNETVSRQTYHKNTLFFLTEGVPDFMDVPWVRSHFPWLGSWSPGESYDLLTLNRTDGSQVLIAPLICLDAVVPALGILAAREGADLIVTLSNDTWFGDSRGTKLHHAVAAFRSIETRLPQLRATNTGITSAITATGDLLAQTDVGTPIATLTAVRPGKLPLTLFVRWGQWLGPLGLFLAVLALMGARSKKD